jgi:membrane protease YdiL (CAAX protease family)
MLDTQKLLTIFIEAGSLISVLASVTGVLIMFRVTKKFGTGILATGFKTIAVGILFIAAGIFIDAFESYLEISIPVGNLNEVLLLAKAPLFIIGTYIIVIGIKKTGDHLESLTK